jgi:glycine/D-amino acid oxidase-like deaminating enzyme
MKQIVIVGGGMFGCVLRDFLAYSGVDDVIVIDSGEEFSGTNASGNVTKPSWVTGLGSFAKQAYTDLDRVYGLNKFSPEIGLGKTIDLFYVDKAEFAVPPNLNSVVTEVGNGFVKTYNPLSKIEGGINNVTVVVCAGAWSNQLVKMPELDAMTGVSFMFKEPPEYKPTFNVWAPYKQSISYSQHGYVWFGDGTAIKEKNWSKERIYRSIERAADLGLTNPIETNVGYRPYVKGYKNGYLAQVYENTWVNTGGGKNGIVLAAFQARQFMEWLSDHH